jgi:hypothetical protein
VRGNDVMIANNNLRIEQGDHVIMFLTDKKFIPTSKDYSSQVLSSCNSGVDRRLFYPLYIKGNFSAIIYGNGK